MNCPFCGVSLKAIGLICPNCKSDLPKVELIPIYEKILNERREMGKVENRSKLDEAALYEYNLRLRLIEVAKSEESKRQRIEKIKEEETLRKQNEENAKNSIILGERRANRNKIISKILIVALIILAIPVTGKFILYINNERKVWQDCNNLTSAKDNNEATQSSNLIDIANLSFLMKSIPYAPYFKFEVANAFLEKRISGLASQSYVSKEIAIFMDTYKERATRMSSLLQKGKTGQTINDLKDGKISLFVLSVQQLSQFNSNPCFDDLAEQGTLIEGLSSSSEERSVFVSRFLVTKPTAKLRGN